MFIKGVKQEQLKIAVLLRGQPRFTREGAKLFEMFVMKKYPKVDFKFFFHTWNNIPRFMVEEDVEFTGTPIEERIKVMSYDETYDLIKCWNPVRYKIESAKTTIDLGRKILFNNTKENYEYVNDMLTQYFKKLDNSRPRDNIKHIHMLYGALNPEFNISDLTMENLEIGILNYHRFIHFFAELHSQHLSSIKAYELLEDYQKENPDYIPDLVMLARPDTLINIEDLIYIYNYVYRRQEFHKKAPVVLGNGGFVTHSGIGTLDDKLFFCTTESVKNFLSGGENRLYNCFTRTSLFERFMLNSDGQVHGVWFMMADKELYFFSLESKYTVNIIRDNCLDNDFLEKSYNDLDKFFENFIKRFKIANEKIKIAKGEYRMKLSKEYCNLMNREIEQ